MEPTGCGDMTEALSRWLASLSLCPLEGAWRDTRSWLADQAMIARALDGELLALSVGDPRNAYGRTVLRAGPEVEVMVARWTPGRGCAPHDHGGSTGVVRVLQGEATHVWYHIQDGALVEVGQERAGAGDLLLVDPALIHAMRPADGVPLVTLHLYAAPIASMAVFDCHAKRSLRVTGRSGAWIPDDPSLILRELPGIALPPPE